MLSRIYTLLSLTALALLAAGGVSQAESGYPSAATVTVNVTGDAVSVVDGTITVIAGGTFTFSGVGFDPAEVVGITVDGPSGLRSTPGLSQLVAQSAVPDAAADGNGNFATSVTLDQLGTNTLRAIGRDSGKSASLTVTVVTTASNSEALVAGAGTGANTTAGSVNEAGLASTGAPLAGPLAIGFLALFAGLALLFFGTRGVRRRRSALAR